MTTDKIIDSLTHTLWDTQMVMTRLLLGVAEFWWGLLLIWPGMTFGRPTYHHMASVMCEESWALVFLASSATQITIVLRRDFHCALARYFACWNMVLWVYVVVSMLLSVYPPPAAISAEITLAMAAVWIWLRPYLLAKGIQDARGSRF